MKIVSVAVMRKLESRAAASGVSGFAMMRSAGEAAAEAIADLFRKHPGVNRVAVVTGKGNNAGDGFAAAAAMPPDIPVEIHASVPLASLRGDAAAHAGRLPGRIPVRESAAPPEFKPDTLIVDALLGIGFRGEPREPLDGFIRAVNASGCPVAALDLPSGLDGDSGRAGRDAVAADLTVTFGLPKTGLFTGDGPRLCGSLRLGGIGIPRSMLDDVQGSGEAFFAQDARGMLPRLPHDSHKNTRGRTLVVAGSATYPGAAVLSALGALRGGSGMVRLASPVMPEHQLPAAVIRRRLSMADDGGFGASAAAELDDLLTVSDAVVAGPGWTVGEQRRRMLRRLLLTPLPTVLDADALNLLAERPLGCRGNVVLTPHPGEAGRLFAAYGVAAPEDRRSAALKLAEATGAVVVLKGPQSVVAAPDGRSSYNTAGSAALATAGSGDVLAGLTGALLAGGMDAYDAARLAALLHALAGEAWPRRGLCADDLPGRLPGAFAAVSPLA